MNVPLDGRQHDRAAVDRLGAVRGQICLDRLECRLCRRCRGNELRQEDLALLKFRARLVERRDQMLIDNDHRLRRFEHRLRQRAGFGFEPRADGGTKLHRPAGCGLRSGGCCLLAAVMGNEIHGIMIEIRQ